MHSGTPQTPRGMRLRSRSVCSMGPVLRAWWVRDDVVGARTDGEWSHGDVAPYRVDLTSGTIFTPHAP